MLNQVVLVGRITKDPEYVEGKPTFMTIAVPRAYKNENGEYDTDFIRCVLWNGVAQNVAEYCKKGDLIGIKGRVQTSKYDDSEGVTHYTQDIIAEKVTFLSSKPKDEE